MSAGSTGRSFTTESAPFPWIRRARTTTPTLSSFRSGVSKKKIWRICASSGSMPSATAVDRWSGSGTVSFNSTLSDSLMRERSCVSSSLENIAAVVIDPPLHAAGKPTEIIVSQFVATV